MLNFFKILKQKRIYLDYASITPMDPRVLKYVSKISKEYPANPSSLYREGVQAEKKLQEARSVVARQLDVHADEIIFTSGGTESNNLAIRGVLEMYLKNSESSETHKAQCKHKQPHIITSEIEHPAVRELLLQYKEQGICDVTFVGVNEEGIVDLKELKNALRPETILVSVMYVNNEIGTIQPISEISKIVRQYKQHKKEVRDTERTTGRSQAGASPYPYVHTDACQAALFCPLRVINLGVDLLTLDGSKIYGPRSTGVLYVKRGTKVKPQQIGGSQEHDMRAGTENVANACGFAYAIELTVGEREKEATRMAHLRDILIEDLKEYSKNLAALNTALKIVFNGSYASHERVPNNINICIPGIDAEYAVLRLDVRGVCVSSVTSCRSKKEDSSSYVVEALNGGSGLECGKSSLRITLGRFTTRWDVKVASKILISTLTRMI